MLSLLAHEVAHAVVARRHGVEVEDITLWLLGGVARLKGDAPTPGADFRIAVVGPLVSMLAAVGFAVLGWLMAIVGVGEPWTPVVGYLAVVNAILAVFNLIPAAPLDGGRVLRAALWAWKGDRTSAAVWSARAGRAFGLFLLTAGVFGFLFGYGGGFWWVLLGLFILVMASAEERQAEMGSALEGLRVRDVMTQDPDTAPGDVDIEEFLQQTAMLRRHSAFPLLDESGRLEGLITFNRMKAVPAEGRSRTTLREAACPPGEIPLAGPDDRLDELLARMSDSSDRRALVFSEGRLVGIVSPSDISRAVTLRGFGVSGPRLAG
nr:site-2 protease family protein [Glycomyces sp. L485]